MRQLGDDNSVPAGARIRERRLSLGRAQADLARDAGISPAYLNLIEHDRRPLTEALRARLAQALGVSEAELDASRTEALMAQLRLAAQDQAVETDRLPELVARFPLWSGLLADLAGRNEALNERLADLSDRVTQDPYLLATLHEILSAVTALRSTAQVLASAPDMAADWRLRFHGNIDQDSRRLSVTAQALVAYLESFEADTGLISPQEEFEGWTRAGRPDGGLSSDAARALARQWDAARAEDAAALPDSLLNRLIEASTIQSVTDQGAASADQAPPPRSRARRGDTAQVVGSQLSPAEIDPACIAAQSGLPLELVLRRMGEVIADAGLLICDGAGVMLYRLPARGMSLPRPGDRCTMLPLYQALGQPGSPVSRVVETVGGKRFRCFAYATRSQPSGFDGPALSRAVMLFLPDERPIPDPERILIGPTCRICPRDACPARREPSILAPGSKAAQMV
ncbi:MAG: short-chain fatty acyl-CoA regulator family protein [Paracoccus sp. (in: a-proteobacteria)]|nr:short-chain fatty acyl-CoA regulator family protein [Paracoccus sp. (in: a-proteobacteria)]